jgi:hypothetical protein
MGFAALNPSYRLAGENAWPLASRQAQAQHRDAYQAGRSSGSASMKKTEETA